MMTSTLRLQDNLAKDMPVEMTNAQSFKLSDYKGKNLVLFFYPRNNTPGCTSENIAFRELHDEFESLGVEILGISRDNMRSHERFKEKLGLPFELIADEDETLCALFDVIRNKKMYGKVLRGIQRSTFLINADGEIAKEWRNLRVAEHANEVLDAAKSLIDN